MTDSKITFILSAIDRGASRVGDKVGKSIGGLEGASGRARSGIKSLGGALVTLGKVGVLGVITALVAATAAMGNALAGAIEEEKGIARLDAALRANVKGWNGNTAAIEAAIDKRMALAFTDDELRQSMGTLVTATGDVDKALRLQAVAMDLARLKNISLDDASKLLIKAQNGNTRALKELGIVLPKTATQTEILAAIQKKTAGQAEAYGNTTAGAFEKFQIAMGELLEDVAVEALPLLTGLARMLSDKVIPAVSRVIANVKRWVTENRPLIDQVMSFVGGALRLLVSAVGTVIGVIGKVIGKIVEFANSIAKNKPVMEALRGVVNFIAGAFQAAFRWVGNFINNIGALVGEIRKNKPIMDALRFIASAIAGAFDMVRLRIGWAVDGLKALITWASNAMPKLRDLLNVLRLLPGVGGAIAGFVPKAAGGPVSADRTYLVGENGPELFRPSGSGSIVPNHQLAGAGSGGVNVIQLVVDGRVLAEIVDKHLYRELQRAPAIVGG